MPASFTCGVVESRLNIYVNGPSFGDSKPFLLSAVDKNGIHKIVKLLRVNTNSLQSMTNKIAEREMEKEAGKILNLSEVQDGLVTAEVITIDIPHQEAHHTGGNGGQVVALVMPKYQATVATSPRFFPDTILNEGKRILIALQFIHSRGLVHMDIKADNIFIDTQGHWAIGDFGSCKHVNDLITSSSDMFYFRKFSTEKALFEYDYYMLLVMILIETLDNKHSFKERFFKNSDRVDDNFIRMYANDVISIHVVGPLVKDLLQLIEESKL